MIKKKKIIFLPIMTLILLLAMSCASKPKDNKNPEDNNDTNNNNVEELNLSSISVDSSATKTMYYLGEEFSSEGLKVDVNYLKLDENNQTVLVKEPCTTYYLDLSAVDMNTVGTYTVRVVFRQATKTVNANYNIQVKSSLFNDSGLEYLSGLETSYEGEIIKELKIDEKFTFDKNLLTVKLHTTQMVDGKLVQSIKEIDKNKITIENTVDTSKVGTYMIKYTYAGEPLLIDGKSYENKVVSYTIVNVVNPVVKIEKVSTNDLRFRATTDEIDFSVWKIKITREVNKGDEIVSCTRDLFEITGVCSYIVGNNQNVKVTLLEDSSKTIQVPTDIIASNKQDILIGNTFNKNMTEGTTSIDKGKVQVDDSGLFFANFSETNDKKTREDNSKGADGVSFSTRITINTAASFEIKMDKPGVIIVYASSTGDDAREFALVNAEDEELGTGLADLKNTPKAYRFNVSEAGTYRIISLSSTIYVHGCVVATNKN